jgi:excinuclease ABC subunit A
MFSEQFACLNCNIYYDEIEPRSFSFNSPFGACKTCDGLGMVTAVDESLVVSDPKKSIDAGCFALFNKKNKNWYYAQVSVVCATHNISTTTPWEKLPRKQQQTLLFGDGKKQYEFSYGDNIRYKSGFEGIMNNLSRRFKETDSQNAREYISRYMDTKMCESCNGARLRKESLSVRVNNIDIHNYCQLNIADGLRFIEELNLTGNKEIIARQILKEIRDRLYFLNNVGLSYLNLNRTAGTLSGGEAQRIRLATQIGSQLCGVLYILDEPSIGC